MFKKVTAALCAGLLFSIVGIATAEDAEACDRRGVYNGGNNGLHLGQRKRARRAQRRAWRNNNGFNNGQFYNANYVGNNPYYAQAVPYGNQFSNPYYYGNGAVPGAYGFNAFNGYGGPGLNTVLGRVLNSF